MLVWGLQVYKDWVGRATYSFLPPAAALSELQLPAQLSAFKLWQEKARGAMKSKLISEWVPTVVNIMMDNLDSTFDFYCHSMDKVDGSDLQRFLLYLRLFMTDGIRSLALNSVADWIAFMELFSDTGGNGGAPAPLLQVDLQLVDGPDGPTYMFEPPLQVCVDTILSMFDKSVEGMGGVPCADHLLMPLADVGESSLPHVTLNDATVAAARRRLETILEESLAG
eukprot:COSAG01_NODE_10620_length_2119_cov_9.627228_3_plen_223_part_01